MRYPRHTKTKYRTVSLPTGLTDDIQEIIDKYGYWPGINAFVRDAALEKLKREQAAPGRFVPVPILAFEPEEKEKTDVFTEINKVVRDLEKDPNVPEEEKEVVRDFASKVSKSLTELDNIFKNGDEEKRE